MVSDINHRWLQQFTTLFFEQSLLDYNLFSVAVDLKNSNIPSRLFKYRKPNSNTLTSLRSLTGWFAPCSDQNDTFEAIGKVDYNSFASKNIIDDIKIIMPEFNKKIEAVIKEPNLAVIKNALDEIAINSQKNMSVKSNQISLQKEYQELLKLIEKYKSDQSESLPVSLRKRFSLFSLSEDNLSTPMWSYYADDHKGICIEYNFNGLVEGEYLKNQLFPIVYSDNIIDITPFIIKATKDRSYYSNPLFLILPVLNKTIKWKHEYEWRIINTNNFDNIGKSLILPKPKSVILGLKICKDYEDQIRDICMKQEIQVRKIRVNNSTRRLEEI